MKSMH